MRIKRSFNATTLTDFPRIACNGEQKACALRAAIWDRDRFWVLGREGWCCGLRQAVREKTYIHEWTGDGSYIKTVEVSIPPEADSEIDRGSETANSAPEVRDMATDEWRWVAFNRVCVPTRGQGVFFVSEEGIYVTGVDGNGIWHLCDQIAAASGTKTVGAGEFVNDANGNGGNGPFWVGADDGYVPQLHERRRVRRGAGSGNEAVRKGTGW